MILMAAIEKYQPKHVIALFSGGHDSLVSTHYALQRVPSLKIAHLNTGIGIEATRKFVRETVQGWDKELLEYRADEYVRADGIPDPQIYAEIVKEQGFPGPAMHTTMYNRFKERPLRQLIRELPRSRKDKTLLVTGVRSQESQRRMRHVEPVQIWEGTKIWVAPIWDFSAHDINRYIEKHGLKRNMVSDLLHGSKECLCGAYAHPGELEEIALWFPEDAEKIKRLQIEVRDSGFPWGWEEGPPDWFQKLKAGFRLLPGLDNLAEHQLCGKCRRTN